MRSRFARRWFGGVVVLAIFASACAGASAAGGGGTTLRISAPGNGAKVTEPFTIKLDSSVPLGDPSTGRNHVHFCFDGADCNAEYKLTYGDSFQVTDLAPGMHTIEASLRNADHSDAGVHTMITVNVTGAGGSTPGPVQSGPPGYGY
jgi:hypothetical protein